MYEGYLIVKAIVSKFTTMKDLNKVNRQKQLNFIKSFDYIFFNVDEVLMVNLTSVSGAYGLIRSLQRMGKHVGVISNNGMISHGNLSQFINNPVENLIAYLKAIKFTRKLFVLAMPPFKKALTEAGFKLEENKLGRHPQSVRELAAVSRTDPRDDVGAVVFDFDVNVNLVDLIRACDYGRRTGVLFLAGGADKMSPLGPKMVPAMGYFYHIVEYMTNKKPIFYAMPSQVFGQNLEEKFKIDDRSRVLLVGDKIQADIGLDCRCKFQKLLVGDGRKEEVLKKLPEEYEPQFYINSLGMLDDVIRRIERG